MANDFYLSDFHYIEPVPVKKVDRSPSFSMDRILFWITLYIHLSIFCNRNAGYYIA
jgi:hypothetical protein